VDIRTVASVSEGGAKRGFVCPTLDSMNNAVAIATDGEDVFYVGGSFGGT
jgi:hypothetical protein